MLKNKDWFHFPVDNQIFKFRNIYTEFSVILASRWYTLVSVLRHYAFLFQNKILKFPVTVKCKMYFYERILVRHEIVAFKFL